MQRKVPPPSTRLSGYLQFMRVLHFFKTYYPDTTGGIEQVIFQLCQGTRTLGVDSQVLTLSPTATPSTITVGTHEVTRAKETFNLASTGFSTQVFSQFRRMAEQADLVHYHFPWPFMDVVHFACGLRKPSVLSYHSDIIKQKTLLKLYTPLMHRFLGSMNRILVASPNYLQSSETLQRHRDRVVVVPYGLDPDATPSFTEERLAYWRQRVPEKFFLFVGVLRYYKGLATLLDALEGTGYPLVIVGSGPEEQALKAQADRLKLNNVLFLGRLDDADKACLLHLCHALAFPSHLRSEAFGISLLEASMHGKPMISCEIGTGTTFVNLHEITGLAVPPAEPTALREALRRLWTDEALAQRFGLAAKARFDSQFTAHAMCEKTVEVYQKLL